MSTPTINAASIRAHDQAIDPKTRTRTRLRDACRKLFFKAGLGDSRKVLPTPALKPPIKGRQSAFLQS